MSKQLSGLINSQSSIQIVTLNGVNYTIRTYYNILLNIWMLDLFLASTQEPVAIGLALVPNINLLSFSENLTNTIGQLRCIDTSGDQNGGSAQNSLGNTLNVYYFEPNEFETSFSSYKQQEVKQPVYNFDDYFNFI